MCSPIALGIIGGLASTAANYASQSQLQSRQDAENQRWMAEQRRLRQAENERQEMLRQRAEVSRQEGVEKLAAPEQQKAQSVEEARLEKEYAPTITTENAGDQLLSGQAAGGTAVVEEVGKRVAEATKTARDRIAAMARIQSYGNSFGGLDRRNEEVLTTAGQGIDLQNKLRQGSLAAYGVEGAQDPVRYVASPTAGLVGGLANSIAGAFGNVSGSMAGRSNALRGLSAIG